MKGVPYRELVGALLYANIATRPDISYAISNLCKFMSDPGPKHWETAKRVLRYLKGTKDVPLVLGGEPTLRGYTDADFAGDRDDRKSTGAYVFTIGHGAVSWKAKKQVVTALSTLEAEYMAMTQAAKEAVWIRQLIRELGSSLDAVTLFGDNQGAISLARNAVFHYRTKHIDVQYHFIREQVANGTIDLQYLATDQMVADILTKATAPTTHFRHCHSFGLYIPSRT
jgi:hypothetical protein